MSDKPDVEMTDSEWMIVRDILRRHLPDHSVWAFGSRVRRTHKPFSDLPWKVDIVDWASASHSFRQLIEAHKVPLQ